MVTEHILKIDPTRLADLWTAWGMAEKGGIRDNFPDFQLDIWLGYRPFPETEKLRNGGGSRSSWRGQQSMSAFLNVLS